MPRKATARMRPAPEQRPARAKRGPVKVPFDRFPGAATNGPLRRALVIHYAQQAGMGRDEAVAYAEAQSLARLNRPAPAHGRSVAGSPFRGEKRARDAALAAPPTRPASAAARKARDLPRRRAT